MPGFSGRCQGARFVSRRVLKRPALFVGVAVLAAMSMFAGTPGASADSSAAQLCMSEGATPAALSRPVELDASPNWAYAAFRGLSCSRCNSATQFCVLNPIRYEYACAPLGSVACISAERTHWCPSSRGCWAGRCR